MPIARALLTLPLTALLLAAAEPERSVVQIITYSQQPDWVEPWRFSGVRKSSGSGFLIEGGRVMTNAHVVSWARQILVLRYQDPKPYPAEVEFAGHDCDLAVLRVLDPAFYDGMESLELGQVPAVRSTVTTYGYPAGGQQISYTRGVVSRIEMQGYAHIANRSFLTVQTDAAINPGNSGGPVIQDGKVVGVSFQGRPGLENAGFFIPPNVIRHFLEDIEDGRYEGFPDAGLLVTPLQNPAFRERLGLEDDSRGARVDRILEPFPDSRERLRENDVILSVDGYEVGSDGLTQFEGNRVHAAMIFDQAQHGEQVRLEILRDGKPLEIELPVRVNRADRHFGLQYDAAPPYLLVGGLVFTELSRNYLSSLGRDWDEKISSRAVYELIFRPYGDPERAAATPIVLSKVLEHPVNVDFAAEPREVIHRVNGRSIGSIAELAEAIDDNAGAYHRFEFLSGTIEVLPREAAGRATAELMETYRIPAAVHTRKEARP